MPMLNNLPILVCISFLLSAEAFAPEFFNRRDDEISTNIVGGEPAYVGEFPYQVQVLRNNGKWCGGSIIGPSTILTAAHCFNDRNPGSYFVRAGHTSHSNPGPYAQTRRVSQVIVHPRYLSVQTGNDIAILKLSSPFTYNSYVNEIPIPNQGSTHGTSTGTNLIASGWGDTYEGEREGSEDLLKVILPVVSPSTCSAAYNGQVYTSQVCAGYTEGGFDTCQGDSGGPLATTTEPRVLVGVVSWGKGCAQEGYPGIYTKVSSFTNWIVQYKS